MWNAPTLRPTIANVQGNGRQAWVDEGMQVVLEAATNNGGNVLVFLPGAADIRVMQAALQVCKLPRV